MAKNQICGHVHTAWEGQLEPLTCDLPAGHNGDHSGECLTTVKVGRGQYGRERKRSFWKDVAGEYPVVEKEKLLEDYTKAELSEFLTAAKVDHDPKMKKDELIALAAAVKEGKDDGEEEGQS
ncbi:hypothetical protein KQH61_05970 [bacterium]|nr:hypothetical protein [bacterium]